MTQQFIAEQYFTQSNISVTVTGEEAVSNQMDFEDVENDCECEPDAECTGEMSSDEESDDGKNICSNWTLSSSKR